MNAQQIWDSAVAQATLLHTLKPLAQEIADNPYAAAKKMLVMEARIRELEEQHSATIKQWGIFK